MDSLSTSRAFPGFDRLFRLSDGASPGAMRADIEGLSVEQRYDLFKGRWRTTTPLRASYRLGKHPLDVIFTTAVISVFLHDRVATILQEIDATGWETFPITVFDKDENEIPGYHGLAISGRCGQIENWRSEVVLRPPPVPNGKASLHQKGLYFDPLSWDGSDFFTPPDRSGWMFVSWKVTDALKRAKVRGVCLTPLCEFSAIIPDSQLASFTPPNQD